MLPLLRMGMKRSLIMREEHRFRVFENKFGEECLDLTEKNIENCIMMCPKFQQRCLWVPSVRSNCCKYIWLRQFLLSTPATLTGVYNWTGRVIKRDYPRRTRQVRNPRVRLVPRPGLGYIHPSVLTALVKAQNDYESWLIYFELLHYLLSFITYRQLLHI